MIKKLLFLGIVLSFCASFLFAQNINSFHDKNSYLPDISGMKTDTEISIDSNTTLIGRWANGPCRAIDVKDNIACFGNGAYLEIVDVSNPSNLIEMSKIILPSSITNVVISGSYAYVTVYDASLRIIDISDPANPTEVGYFDTGGSASGVTVSGSYAYVADARLQ